MKRVHSGSEEDFDLEVEQPPKKRSRTKPPKAKRAFETFEIPLTVTREEINQPLIVDQTELIAWTRNNRKDTNPDQIYVQQKKALMSFETQIFDRAPGPTNASQPNWDLIWLYIHSLTHQNQPVTRTFPLLTRFLIFSELKPIEKQILRLILRNLTGYLNSSQEIRDGFINNLRQFDTKVQEMKDNPAESEEDGFEEPEVPKRKTPRKRPPKKTSPLTSDADDIIDEGGEEPVEKVKKPVRKPRTTKNSRQSTAAAPPRRPRKRGVDNEPPDVDLGVVGIPFNAVPVESHPVALAVPTTTATTPEGEGGRRPSRARRPSAKARDNMELDQYMNGS